MSEADPVAMAVSRAETGAATGTAIGAAARADGHGAAYAGDLIVAAARSWLGTPYVHQASCKGAGADCLGLIRGLWREGLGAEPLSLPAYTPDWSEASGDEALLSGAARLLVRVAAGDEQPGDVIVFRMRHGAVAKHLGLLAVTGDTTRFIHAYSGHGVVESPLTPPWARRIVAHFRFPAWGARPDPGKRF